MGCYIMKTSIAFPLVPSTMDIFLALSVRDVVVLDICGALVR